MKEYLLKYEAKTCVNESSPALTYGLAQPVFSREETTLAFRATNDEHARRRVKRELRWDRFNKPTNVRLFVLNGISIKGPR
ncbi:MAG: hypothetical protein AAB458_01360 [Patescibacteria group bacterium]